jgi:hypothetical protein
MSAASIILEFVKRRYGGVTPAIRLESHECESLRVFAEPARRRFFLWLIPSWLACSALATYLLVEWRLHLDGPAVNAIVNQRPRYLSLGLGFVIILWLGWLASFAELVLLPRLMGWERALWVRYHATTRNIMPAREAWLVSVSVIPFALVMTALMWNWGTRIDESGIAIEDLPFARRVEPYPNVVAIELYQGVNAPVGVRMGENVLVRFANGETWAFGSDQSGWAAPRDVADYIAARANKPVQQLGIRP